MLIGAVTVGVGAIIVLGIKILWRKTNKQKLKKYSIIVCLSLLIAIAVICIANACIPELSQEEVKSLVIAELEPQIAEVEKALGISNISIDFDIYEYEYKKPTVFSKGYIGFEMADYYVSSNFFELESGIYTDETCNKYRKIDSLVLSDIKLDRYKVNIKRLRYLKTDFKDSSGNEYSFNKGQIFKNGYFVYGESWINYDTSSKSTNGNNSSVCSWCGGDGRTHDWVDNGNKCTKCGGTGRLEYDN